MDPVQRSVTALLSALRGVQAAAPSAGLPSAPLAALRGLVGQDVSLLLLGTTAEGSQLALPSGQVFSAQGELPFPEGTQLWMRVLEGEPGTGEVRLRTLSAQAPQPAGILAPLHQGEGAALLMRLAQPESTPALAPLAELFRSLAPGPGALQAQVESLPAATQAALRAVLGAPPEASLAEALQGWAAALGPARSGEALPALPEGAEEALPPALARLLQAVVDRHPEAPRDALLQVLKQALGRPLSGQARPGETPGASGTGSQGPSASAASPQGAAAARAGALPAQPETWESWLRAAVRGLADPAASPREAPFHLAQAREGTAFFEIPLPWSPQAPLQMWVESDREGDGKGDRERTRTVLLGLKFTCLGETRLGIAKGPAGLQVRVWAEHPEALSAQREEVEEALREVGSAVDLRILPLNPGPGGFVPSLKSLLAGPSLQALG